MSVFDLDYNYIRKFSRFAILTPAGAISYYTRKDMIKLVLNLLKLGTEATVRGVPAL